MAETNVCWQRGVFLDFEPIAAELVTSTGEVAVAGIGSVDVTLWKSNLRKTGETVSVRLRNVLFVPSAVANVASVRELEIQGFGVSFSCKEPHLLLDGENYGSIKKNAFYNVFHEPNHHMDHEACACDADTLAYSAVSGQALLFSSCWPGENDQLCHWTS